MTRGFLRFLRRNTIALLALFLALGGTTWAASTALLGKNTVASPQVVNGSLQTKDLSAKARLALKGNRGPRGLTGAAGAAGAAGSQGPKGPTGAQGVQGIQGPKGDSGPAIAWGYINADGTVNKASSNVTSTWNAGSSRYEIGISGESYFFSSYVTLVTPTAGTGALTAQTSSVGGKLLVLFKDTGGTAQQTPFGFQFVTFKP